MVIFAILAVTFIAGAIAGAIGLVSLGIAREESNGSLRRAAPTRTTAATRRVLDYSHQLPTDEIGSQHRSSEHALTRTR
jgi:hypothetical protein